MDKRIWVSALSKNADQIRRITLSLRDYGFNCQGHIWLDDAPKLAWRGAYDELVHEQCRHWVILADEDSLKCPTIRYGLSLMTYAMLRDNPEQMPIITLAEKQETLELLPPILRKSQLILTSQNGWEAKFVAATIKVAPFKLPYRINTIGDAHIGQWFEIGSTLETWHGLAFGVAGLDAVIDFQGVGPAGSLPDKSILEYPMEGIKIDVRETAFTAWAVTNLLDSKHSYYVRVRGLPDQLLLMPGFKPAADDDDEAYIVALT